MVRVVRDGHSHPRFQLADAGLETLHISGNTGAWSASSRMRIFCMTLPSQGHSTCCSIPWCCGGRSRGSALVAASRSRRLAACHRTCAFDRGTLRMPGPYGASSAPSGRARHPRQAATAIRSPLGSWLYPSVTRLVAGSCGRNQKRKTRRFTVKDSGQPLHIHYTDLSPSQDSSPPPVITPYAPAYTSLASPLRGFLVAQ